MLAQVVVYFRLTIKKNGKLQIKRGNKMVLTSYWLVVQAHLRVQAINALITHLDRRCCGEKLYDAACSTSMERKLPSGDGEYFDGGAGRAATLWRRSRDFNICVCVCGYYICVVHLRNLKTVKRARLLCSFVAGEMWILWGWIRWELNAHIWAV